MNKRFQAATAVALLGAVLMGSATLASGGSYDSEVNIVNHSDWSIYELYVSSADSEEWGDDQLGSEVIESGGGSFLLHSIPCDDYDVRLVDEDGDECVVSGVALCADNDDWVISNDDLLSCQVLTE